MSYKSKYTGAKIDELLEKCDGYPAREELVQGLTEMQDADLSALGTTATASSRTVRATLQGGTVKSVTLPSASTTSAGMMSAADKATLTEVEKQTKVAMPLYMEGVMYVPGNNFLSSTEVEIPTSGTLTLTASDTGAKKKIYDRFMLCTPECLLVPVCSLSDTTTAVATIPFMMEPTRLTSSTRVSVKYRSAMVLNSGYDTYISVTINHTAKTVAISRSETAQEGEEDITPLLPFLLKYFSINADGSVSPTGVATTYDASSTGELKNLYDRVQKGVPPALGVEMTNSDGTQTLVWAYLDSVTGSGKSKVYMSGVLANGTISGKQLRVILSASKVQCQMITSTTT